MKINITVRGGWREALLGPGEALQTMIKKAQEHRRAWKKVKPRPGIDPKDMGDTFKSIEFVLNILLFIYCGIIYVIVRIIEFFRTVLGI